MTIIIPKKVYWTIVAASVRFANARIPKDDWWEVYGVFIGKNKKKDVIISEAYPITHQIPKPEDIIDKVSWADEDYESLYLIDDEAFAKGEFVVGWWHSHPGFKVMMSHIDIRTTLSYQQNNPLAISLVFNPERLTRQIEMPNVKGDPVIQLKNDPGFKIFRLDDVNRGVEASYHVENDYKIEGFKDIEQCVIQTQKFVIDVTKYFPKDNLFETYQNLVNEQITTLNSQIVGTEEYLKTLVRQGESKRVPEVLENQQKEIRKYVAETFLKIENIKEFMNHLEYKERQIIVPKVKEILSQWDETITQLDAKMKALKKKF